MVCLRPSKLVEKNAKYIVQMDNYRDSIPLFPLFFNYNSYNC